MSQFSDPAFIVKSIRYFFVLACKHNNIQLFFAPCPAARCILYLIRLEQKSIRVPQQVLYMRIMALHQHSPKGITIAMSTIHRECSLEQIAFLPNVMLQYKLKCRGRILTCFSNEKKAVSAQEKKYGYTVASYQVASGFLESFGREPL